MTFSLSLGLASLSTVPPFNAPGLVQPEPLLSVTTRTCNEQLYSKISSSSDRDRDREYEKNKRQKYFKGWLAIAKLKPLSLLASLLSIPKKVFDNVKIEK